MADKFRVNKMYGAVTVTRNTPENTIKGSYSGSQAQALDDYANAGQLKRKAETKKEKWQRKTSY